MNDARARSGMRASQRPRDDDAPSRARSLRPPSAMSPAGIASNLHLGWEDAATRRLPLPAQLSPHSQPLTRSGSPPSPPSLGEPARPRRPAMPRVRHRAAHRRETGCPGQADAPRAARGQRAGPTTTQRNTRRPLAQANDAERAPASRAGAVETRRRPGGRGPRSSGGTAGAGRVRRGTQTCPRAELRPAHSLVPPLDPLPPHPQPTTPPHYGARAGPQADDPPSRNGPGRRERPRTTSSSRSRPNPLLHEPPKPGECQKTPARRALSAQRPSFEALVMSSKAARFLL